MVNDCCKYVGTKEKYFSSRLPGSFSWASNQMNRERLTVENQNFNM